MFRYGLLFLLLAAGCRMHQTTYAETLQPWLGQTEERLQQSWGYPYSTFFITPEQKEISYIKFASHPMGGITEPYSYEINDSAISMSNFGLPEQQSTNYYCQTSFTIRNGIVVDYSFSGDDCVALY